MWLRRAVKHGLAATERDGAGRGVTLLIYHRVAGGTPDERDVALGDFVRQLDRLGDHEVVSLDAALDGLDRGEDTPRVVLTFDDGFADVHETAFPRLAERGLPFTLYVSTAYLGRTMDWPGSTARATGPGLTWGQVADLAASPLCTIANHTHTHPTPDRLTLEDVDRCSALLASELGVTARHFAYPWGRNVPALEPALRTRFRSVATGTLGRNHPASDRARLHRVPVRQSDPLPMFRAKLTGSLRAERTYRSLVSAAKLAGGRGPERRPGGADRAAA